MKKVLNKPKKIELIQENAQDKPKIDLEDMVSNIKEIINQEVVTEEEEVELEGIIEDEGTMKVKEIIGTIKTIMIRENVITEKRKVKNIRKDLEIEIEKKRKEDIRKTSRM